MVCLLLLCSHSSISSENTSSPLRAGELKFQARILPQLLSSRKKSPWAPTSLRFLVRGSFPESRVLKGRCHRDDARAVRDGTQAAFPLSMPSHGVHVRGVAQLGRVLMNSIVLLEKRSIRPRSDPSCMFVLVNAEKQQRFGRRLILQSVCQIDFFVESVSL